MESRKIVIDGKVTSYDVYSNGTIYSNISKKFLAQVIKKGYYYVCLHEKPLKLHVSKAVHRLVAEAFIENPYNKPQVNHIDGNKLNNDISNLEWVTARENTLHAHRNGLCGDNRGVKNPACVYSEDIVIRICELLNSCKFTNKEIAIITETNEHLVANIRSGVSWKHISSKYSNIQKHVNRFVKFHDYVDYLISTGISNKEIHLLLLNEGLNDKEAYNLYHSRYNKYIKNLCSSTTILL